MLPTADIFYEAARNHCHYRVIGKNRLVSVGAQRAAVKSAKDGYAGPWLQAGQRGYRHITLDQLG